MAAPPRKILIAMDGSKHADYAFDWYIKYFYKDKDEIILLYVDEHAEPAPAAMFAPLTVHPPAALTDTTNIGSISMPASKEDDYDNTNLVSQLQKKLQTAGVRGNVLRVAGVKAGEGVVTASQENRSDMIITGPLGTTVTKAKRPLMGSVSLYIVRKAGVPVLIVRR